MQLDWRRKIRRAMGTENVTLSSLHELIKEKMKTTETHEKKVGQSFIIEGNPAEAFFSILHTCSQ